MATSFSPTPGEAALVNQIFNKHDPQKFGVITGEVAVNVFRGANLSAITLGQIWGIADADGQGFLTRKGVSAAVRLIGWAQKGDTVSGDLVNKPGPLAVIDGYSSSSEPRRAVSPSPGSSRLPPSLTAQDKAKFTRIFNSCGPVGGLLSGQKARDVFVKSKLPLDKLSQIWNLSDTQSRGSLDVTDFIIAMYLIQSSMSGQLPFIPTTLPPGLYEMVSGKGLPGSTVTSHATGNSGSISPSVSSTFPPNVGSGVVQPHLTGRPLQPQYTGQALQQQFTGQLSQHQTGPKSGFSRTTPTLPSFAAASAVQSQPAWDVTPTEKASADKYFDTLDTQNRGYIEGDVAVQFMLLSKLPEDVLALVWDLADLNNDGRLTRDGFAVALYLIQGKLAGKDIPTTLPASLIPPSMRAAPVPTASPFQPPPSEPLRDLIWDDPPSSSATSQPHSTILQPQRTGPLSPFSSQQVTTPQTLGQGPFSLPASNKNLLDDDEDAGVGTSSTAIHDHSAEIGNLQNQLQSTTRSLENTKTERSNVEGTVESQAIQLSTLQTQLGSAKASYETETRLLASLRERFSNQSSDIQKAREELIRAESDLSAIRVEKTEVEQNLMRDKEEIRELQRKMAETGSMIEVAKAEIEKAKKDAKQQKGLLAIAKKQLAAREADRAKAAQELQESVAEAEETKKELEVVEAELSRESPLAATTANGFPLAPSPTLSGDSTTFAAAKPLPGTPGSPNSINGLASPKSNNPFERFAPGSAPRSQSPFLPLANTSIPTATDAVISVPNEATTTTDNPFTFDQAFGSEEPGAAPDVDETSTGTDGTAQPSVPKLAGELNIITNEEVSSPSSDRDLFSTPPMTGLEVLGAGAQTSILEPSVLKLPPPGAPPAAPLTDGPPEAHTDINAQLKELDVDESDSSDEDSEDEIPLAALTSRPPPPPKADAKLDAAKEELVSNGHTWPEIKAEAPFPPAPVVSAPAEAQSIVPFPPAPAQNNSTFPAAASPFAAPPEAPKVANVSDFDKAFGDFAAGAVPTAPETKLSFDAGFDDQFDFGKEGASIFPPPAAAEASSSGSTTFPPAPAGLSGVVIPPASPIRASGFENAFIPKQQSTASLVRPVSTVSGLPPLPQIPESKPFSFDDAFASLSPAITPAVLTGTAPSQPPQNPDAQSPSFEDTSGSNITGRESGFGTTSSRTSSIPQVTQSPVSAVHSDSPTRGATSPRDSLSFPISQPRQASPPPRMASPKARPTTSSSKESSDRNKEQGRPSKISMIRLPFTKKKKTQESLPPPQHLSLPNEGIGRASPAVDDDVEPVKQLCSMGFTRTQAVAALEASSYDFQRALNSLLSG